MLNQLRTDVGLICLSASAICRDHRQPQEGAQRRLHIGGRVVGVEASPPRSQTEIRPARLVELPRLFTVHLNSTLLWPSTAECKPYLAHAVIDHGAGGQHGRAYAAPDGAGCITEAAG